MTNGKERRRRQRWRYIERQRVSAWWRGLCSTTDGKERRWSQRGRYIERQRASGGEGSVPLGMRNGVGPLEWGVGGITSVL